MVNVRYQPHQISWSVMKSAKFIIITNQIDFTNAIANWRLLICVLCCVCDIWMQSIVTIW